MDIIKRLDKIERTVKTNSQDSAPLVIIYKDEEDKEKKLKEYYAKYGEGTPYKGKLILIMLPEHKSNEEALLGNLTKNNDSEQKEAVNDERTDQIN